MRFECSPKMMCALLLASSVTWAAAGCGGSGGSGTDAGADDGGTDAGLIEGRMAPGGWAELSCDEPLWGTWATVDVSDRGILPGTGDVSAALQNLIDGLGEATVLSFPPGTYEINDVVIYADNVVIRGAGPDQTIFQITTGERAFTWSGSEEGNPVQVVEEVPPGGRVVPVADTSSFQVGDVVMVVEDLENFSFPWAQRGRGGIFVIEDVNEFDSEITIDFPLAVGLDLVDPGGKNATVTKLDPVENVGIEDVRIEHVGAGEGDILHVSRVYNLFVRNVETYNTTQYHVFVQRSHGVAVCHSLFEEAQNKGGGGHGYGVLLASLTTNSLVSDNILKDLRHQIAFEVGANYNVISYNYMVDSVRDLCFDQNPAGCADDNWIEDVNQNGLTNGVLETDIVIHGNYPHHNLIEGNVFYIAAVDYIHYENGPGHFFFRNLIKGQPDPYGWWLEGIGIWIDGPSDGQTIIGNHFLNGSVIDMNTHNGPRPPEDVFVGANIIGGTVQWEQVPDGFSLPHSLYSTGRPDWWPQNLEWPPFGPGVVDSATNRIPAQIRYESMQP